MKKYILTLLLAALAFIANAQLLDLTPYDTRIIVDEFFQENPNPDSTMMKMLDYITSYAHTNKITIKVMFVTKEGGLVSYENYSTSYIEDPYEGTYKQ